MECDKKRRSANFTNNDRSLLINIVAKYKDIIENKKTDAVTVTEKNETWKKISKEFNSNGPSCPRDVDTLRRCYENRKKLLKKSAAFQRRQLYKTGGGLPDMMEKKELDDDLLLSIICSKTVTGLEDRFGGDSICSRQLEGELRETTQDQSLDSIEGNIEFVYEVENDSMNAQDNTNQSMNLSKQAEKESKNNNQSNLCSSVLENKWKNYKMDDFKLPPSKELTPCETETPSKNNDNFSQGNMFRRRRRTLVKSLTTSDISEKYNQLLDRRLEIAEYQKQHLQNLVKTEILEHELRVVLLRAQIKNEMEYKNKV